MANVLLVEDEALIVAVLSSAITRQGHTCVTASNGKEGLKRFSEDSFDLVITDIVMPEKEGLEIIVTMRRTMPDVKIIAMSGGGRTGTAEYLHAAETLGAMATLKKPIRLADFVSVLDRCLKASSGARLPTMCST